METNTPRDNRMGWRRVSVRGGLRASPPTTGTPRAIPRCLRKLWGFGGKAPNCNGSASTDVAPARLLLCGVTSLRQPRDRRWRPPRHSGGNGRLGLPGDRSADSLGSVACPDSVPHTTDTRTPSQTLPAVMRPLGGPASDRIGSTAELGLRPGRSSRWWPNWSGDGAKRPDGRRPSSSGAGPPGEMHCHTPSRSPGLSLRHRYATRSGGRARRRCPRFARQSYFSFLLRLSVWGSLRAPPPVTHPLQDNQSYPPRLVNAGPPSLQPLLGILLGFGLLPRRGLTARPQARSVAAALQNEMMGPVDQAVQGTLGEHRIGEQRIPILG